MEAGASFPCSSQCENSQCLRPIFRLIKFNGLQVAPAELEALILSHPSILDAAVIPLPHPDSGEVPKAYAVLKPGFSQFDLAEWVAGKVSPHKRLRGGVEWTDEIPKSPSGKVGHFGHFLGYLLTGLIWLDRFCVEFWWNESGKELKCGPSCKPRVVRRGILWDGTMSSEFEYHWISHCQCSFVFFNAQ